MNMLWSCRHTAGLHGGTRSGWQHPGEAARQHTSVPAYGRRLTSAV